jgi:beta-phosphoglucomutase-like phosphatase (HAD superfamily)
MDADATWDEIGKRFRSGDIVNATRKDLENYLFALAVVQVQSGPNQQRAYQMGDTMRLLLTRKDSQESERRATWIALTALVISVAALVAGIVQAVASVKALNQPAASQSQQQIQLVPPALETRTSPQQSK